MYPEGIDNIPKFVEPTQEFTEREKMIRGRRFLNYIPSVVVENKMLSDTSDAKKCFIERKCSKKLQEHMLSYSYVVVKSVGITMEM